MHDFDSYFHNSLTPFSFRFALSFLDVGDVGSGLKHSFVHNSSFHDGFNIGIGVFGTEFLNIQNNVIHHSVGPGIRLKGESNSLIDNLVIYSMAEVTYGVRILLFDIGQFDY